MNHLTNCAADLALKDRVRAGDRAALPQLLSRDVFAAGMMTVRDDDGRGMLWLEASRSARPAGWQGAGDGVTATLEEWRRPRANATAIAMELGALLYHQAKGGLGHSVRLVVDQKEEGWPGGLWIHPEDFGRLLTPWMDTNNALRGTAARPFRLPADRRRVLRRSAWAFVCAAYDEAALIVEGRARGHPLQVAWLVDHTRKLLVLQTLDFAMWRWPLGAGRSWGGELTLAVPLSDLRPDLLRGEGLLDRIEAASSAVQDCPLCAVASYFLGNRHCPADNMMELQAVALRRKGSGRPLPVTAGSWGTLLSLPSCLTSRTAAGVGVWRVDVPVVLGAILHPRAFAAAWPAGVRAGPKEREIIAKGAGFAAGPGSAAC
jgi:hypothetical protein